jgi:hypothetical protein
LFQGGRRRAGRRGCRWGGALRVQGASEHRPGKAGYHPC